jgi:heme exporter protein C
MDADQGFMQKIFYVHVPMAIVALCGFVFGGVMAIQHLRTGDPRYDLRSYVAIHLSLILGVGVLLTGAIWAKASWGHWWVWDEPTLVSFLIVFLLYATYQPMRFSIEDRERQGRYASVFAIVAGAFVPLNFLAVRLAQAYTHPRVFVTADGGLPAKMQLAFLAALAGMTLLYVTLWRYEMASKNTSAKLRALRRKLAGDEAVAPAGRTAAPSVPIT